MKLLACFVIEEGRMEKLLEFASSQKKFVKINECCCIFSNDEEKITFAFVESFGSGKTQQIDETKKEIIKVLKKIPEDQASFDKICFGIHGGDWGGKEATEDFYDFSADDATKDFITEIKTAYGKNDKGGCEVFFKLFTHSASSRIAARANADPGNFLTLDFQKSVFFCTPENLEALLHQFRIAVNAIDAGYVKEKILSSEIIEALGKHIKELVQGKDSVFGFKQCAEQSSCKPFESNPAIADFFKRINHMNDEFIYACAELESHMRKDVLSRLRH